MGKGKNIGAGRGGWVVIMSTSTSTQSAKQKAEKNLKSAVNNTVNKLILDRRSCEKVHKKLGLPNPVFVTSGIYIYMTILLLQRFQTLNKTSRIFSLA